MPSPALGWATLGVDALGGALGGASQGKAQQNQLREQRRQFDLQEAEKLRHQLEMAPLRDRIIYQMQQRMGMPASSGGLMINRDPLANNQFAGFGDSSQEARQSALNQSNAAYTPGAGGTTPWFYANLLARMGFDPGNVPNWNNPAQPNSTYYNHPGGMPGGLRDTRNDPYGGPGQYGRSQAEDDAAKAEAVRSAIGRMFGAPFPAAGSTPSLPSSFGGVRLHP